MDTLLPEELIALADRVVRENRALGRRVALAESCTGGLVSAALTEIPGSSDVVEAGFVTYSNNAKMSLLGVSADVLETFGAVSTATAWAMAQGALNGSDADIAVAITGVAGPGGGTAKKPVGTVVFAQAVRDGDPEDMKAERHEFGDIGRGGYPASGRAVGARVAVAVKSGSTLLERADHAAERGAEHLPRQHFEHPVLEGEVDREVDRASLLLRPEPPAIAQIFERPVEIFDVDRLRPLLGHPAGEGLTQPLEADDHVRDRLSLRIRSNAHRGYPGQELRVARDIGDQIEHLLRRIGQMPGLGMLGHQRALASFASRAARNRSKSSPA
jgi:nicotinamide-nucleotide amidase